MSEVVISVRGEHEVRRAPEEAVARVTVTAEGADRGVVVERLAARAAPLRNDLDTRKEAGTLVDWTSQRVSVWSERPWNAEGKRLALVHHASVELRAVFTDFAALSWWLGETAEQDDVQVGEITWRLTPDTRVEVERDVATRAVTVAVQRATAYANALGLQTVTPVEIADRGLLSDDVPTTRPMMMRAVEATGSAPALDFRPEEIIVSATVEARFTAR